MLSENGMCDYYAISDSPGPKLSADKKEAIQYPVLDLKEIREKFIQFEDAQRARVTFHIPSMHCSSCIWLLEHLPRLNPAVLSSLVNFPKKEVTVDFRPAEIQLSEIASLLLRIGYAPAINMAGQDDRGSKGKFNKRVLKIGIAGFCFANIMLLSFPEYLGAGSIAELPQLKTYFAWLSLALSLPVLFYSASEFFISAFKAIRIRTLNIDAPIALAVAVTFSRSIYEIIAGGGTSYLDSMTGIVFFMLIARYFQDRVYENITFERDYKSYFPIAVTVLRNGTELNIPVTQLAAGDRILIRNNELIPADSVLLSNRAYIDYSFVTGESQPVRKVKGDKIFAGARQTEGACELQVINSTSQSYLTQLWNNDAFTKRNKEQRITYIDHINKWFTIAVLSAATAGGITWMFIDSRTAIDVFTAVLIVACPCTLLIASSFTNGSVMRALGRYKLYLKNADVIDRLATADTIVFDKTGTITHPNDTNISFVGEPLSAQEMECVVNLAGQSAHPLSRRIVISLPARKESCTITNVNEVSGKGISATVNGQEYTLGSSAFAGAGSEGRKGTEVWLAIDGKVRGRFAFPDKYREGFEVLAEGLQKKFQLELLSGDNSAEREHLQAIFDGNMLFGMSPQDKLERIQELQRKGRKVIMVGDGLNDAGALMQAEAGIAVSDNLNSYFPACDAILDGSELNRLDSLLSFSRVSRKVLIATFTVSVLYNCVGIYFSLMGELSPFVAAVLMPASTFTVIGMTTLLVRIAAFRLLRKK
jgi:P-type Cu+ transporter